MESSNSQPSAATLILVTGIDKTPDAILTHFDFMPGKHFTVERTF